MKGFIKLNVLTTRREDAKEVWFNVNKIIRFSEVNKDEYKYWGCVVSEIQTEGTQGAIKYIVAHSLEFIEEQISDSYE